MIRQRQVTPGPHPSQPESYEERLREAADLMRELCQQGYAFYSCGGLLWKITPQPPDHIRRQLAQFHDEIGDVCFSLYKRSNWAVANR